MDEPPFIPPQRKSLLWPIVFGAVALVTILLLGLFLGSRDTPQSPPVAAVAPAGMEQGEPVPPVAPSPLPTNVVTIRLGEDESNRGLVLIERERDGHTTIESVEGVLARALRVPTNRSEAYCYFQFDPAFKQEDVRRVRIDVEYLDPRPGTLTVHYDAMDAPNLRNPVYREALRSVTLAGSNVWRTASFHTRNDAAFANRQNGGSDFRICTKAPLLYVRRVTVTREIAAEESWAGDFSTSNHVSLLLGQEKPTDGLRHLSEVGDGRTVVTNLDGVACRYLNRLGARSPWGSMYFEISPSFKTNGLENARIEVEYLTKQSNAFRVQFDGMENGRSRSYVPVLPTNSALTRWVTGVEYARAPVVGAWAVATFEITNATFQNSQNDGADFRFEVVPPEVYVRRVTVTRKTP